MTPAANMAAAPMPAGGAGKGGIQQPTTGGGGKGGMNRGPGGNAQNNPGQQMRPGMGGPMGGMMPQWNAQGSAGVSQMPAYGAQQGLDGFNPQNLMTQQWQNLPGGSMGGNWQNIMQKFPSFGSGINMGGWGNDVMPSPPQAPPVQQVEMAPPIAAPTPKQPVKPQFNAAGLPAGGLLANLYGGG